MKFSLKGFGRRLSALVLVVSLLLPTTGCMQQEQEKSDGSVPYEVLVPYPVTVLGERFEQAPERIISLSPVLTRLFYDFGLEDALIGITDNTVLPDGTDSADLLRVGTSTSPDIDMILEANPNFIISMFELPEFETKKIESAGIPILVFPQVWDLSGLETLYRNLGLMFSGAGSNRKTERHVPRDPKYLEAYEAVAADYREITQQINGQKKSYLYIDSPEGLVLTGDTPESGLLSFIMDNAAETGELYTMDMEKLLASPPDFVFYNPEIEASAITESELWQQIPAVQEGRIAPLEIRRLTWLESDGIRAVWQEAAAYLYPADSGESVEESAESEAGEDSAA